MGNEQIIPGSTPPPGYGPVFDASKQNGYGNGLTGTPAGLGPQLTVERYQLAFSNQAAPHTFAPVVPGPGAPNLPPLDDWTDFLTIDFTTTPSILASPITPRDIVRIRQVQLQLQTHSANPILFYIAACELKLFPSDNPFGVINLLLDGPKGQVYSGSATSLQFVLPGFADILGTDQNAKGLTPAFDGIGFSFLGANVGAFAFDFDFTGALILEVYRGANIAA